MSARPAQIDVVIVPDFSGPNRLVFETRALFFLASWLAAHEERGPGVFRPHVCCIGEPPESVRQLAARAGAGISVHEPLLTDYGGFANKLRGLEAPGDGKRLLLLDADVLVFGGLDALADIGADVAAVPAGKPQVSERQWKFIYEALGIPLPQERVASAYGAPGAWSKPVAHSFEEQQAQAAAMLPYHNSGVLLLRRDCGIRETWEDHLRRIPGLFDLADAPAHAVLHGDQVALATAIQALRERGATFAQLPAAFNARLVHYRTGALRVRDTRLLHAAGFASFVRARPEMRDAVENQAGRWSEAIREGLRDQPAERDLDLARARAWLWMLWERWVREACEASGTR